MKPLRRAWSRLRALFSGSRQEAELASELESHIAMQAADNERGGMSPQEALRAAKLKFGAIEAAKEIYRDQRGLPLLEGTVADVRYAARTLRNSPGFTAVAVLTLAVGIGANTAIFSLVNQILLRPDGVSGPERVIVVRTRYGKGGGGDISSATAAGEMRTAPDVFQHVALLDYNFTNAIYNNGVAPERLRGSAVTAEWFDVFGVQPMLGRAFTKDEDQPNQNRVVVLAHASWIRMFGGDPSAVGRTIDLNQTPYQIAGVMPPEFRWPRGTEFWVPAALPPAIFEPPARFNESKYVVGRLQPGVSLDRAKAWFDLNTNRVRQSNTKGAVIANNTDWSLTAVPLIDSVSGSTKDVILLLLGAVAFVLLIACSNIAGLMVARTSARSREIAVRAALGAGRIRLLRQVLAESLLLSLAGGIGGIALAYGAVRVLLRVAPGNAAAGLDAELDANVLLYCAAAALFSGVLFALAPAIQMARVNPNEGLKLAGRSTTVRQRLRSALVVAETALALILLAGAGLFLRSLLRLENVNPGFDPRGVMTAFVVSPPDSRYSSPEAIAGFYGTLLANLRAGPGVVAAGLGPASLPLSGGNQASTFQIQGRPLEPGQPEPWGQRRVITPGYLEALSIPLKRGRYITGEDRAGSEPVILIDERLAQQFWPNQDPLGGYIVQSGAAMKIVGVVGHVVHDSLAEGEGNGTYYIPLLQRRNRISPAMIVRASGDPSNLAAVIRDAVQRTDPQLPVYSMQPMEEYVEASLATRLFSVRLLGFFAATALLLAALGLYGVISYSVAQRTREIGVRMALGAGTGSVLRLVVGQGLRLAAFGAAIGIGLTLFGGGFLKSRLYQVSSTDPATMAATAAVLLAACVLASYFPARRAARVDPMVTLRSE